MSIQISLRAGYLSRTVASKLEKSTVALVSTINQDFELLYVLFQPIYLRESNTILATKGYRLLDQLPAEVSQISHPKNIMKNFEGSALVNLNQIYLDKAIVHRFLADMPRISRNISSADITTLTGAFEKEICRKATR